tara:strand:- start:1740 stop:1934 length:195 start_codon:yes stop_codon:yes gene_type:complete
MNFKRDFELKKSIRLAKENCISRVKILDEMNALSLIREYEDWLNDDIRSNKVITANCWLDLDQY